MKMKGLLGIAAGAMLAAMAVGTVGAQDSASLVLWHAKQDAEGDALLALIDFCADNYGVTVEQVFNPSNTYQDSVRSAISTGEGPDMLIWANDWAGELADAGSIAPVTSLITDELHANASDTAWGLFTYNDDVWGIPYSAKTLAFFYNRALVPDAPETWADVLAISEELALDGVTGLAFQNGFFHSAGFLYSLGGSLMDADGNANFAPDTEGAAAMDAFLQLHQDMYNLAQDPASGVVVDGASPNPGFQQGDVAMVYDGVWNLAQFEQDLGDDLGVAIMPALDNGNVPALFAQGEGFMLSAAAAADEAKTAAFSSWAACVTSVEGQTIAAEEGGLLPVNSAVEVDDPNLAVFGEQFALGTPFPNRAELSQFWGPMGEAITAVSSGGQTPAEARATAYDLIQTGIDSMHAE